MKKLLPLVCVIALAGCAPSSDDGITEKDRQAATRLDEIVKKSGGEWEKISPSDREYLVKEIAQGSEISAKKLVEGKAGKFNARPGGK
jgi:hypothetical protein